MLSFHWMVRKLPRNRRLLEAKVHAAASALGMGEEDDASVVVCGDRRVRTLNRRYRGVNATTDVLAFPCDEPRLLFGKRAGELRLAPAQAPRLLGDVVVNLRQVERQARRHGNPTAGEFAAVTIHGLLHLLGLNHEKACDASLMEACEQRLFRLLKLEVKGFGR